MPVTLTAAQQDTIRNQPDAARNGNEKASSALYRMELRVQNGQAYHPDTARAAGRQALLDAGVPRNRLTDDNIRWALALVGVTLAPPVAPAQAEETATGQAATAGLAEIVVNDAALAGALRMVFNGTAGGRTSPNNRAINHIHIGGNANYNLLFNNQTNVALGTVQFHMDANMTGGQRNTVTTIEARDGGPTTEVWVRANNNIIQV